VTPAGGWLRVRCRPGAEQMVAGGGACGIDGDLARQSRMGSSRPGERTTEPRGGGFLTVHSPSFVDRPRPGRP
jgi:hypothetical protein